MEIISFQDALKLANPLVKKPKLLLGNGFSIAFDKTTFNSISYYDTAVKNKLFDENKRVYKILNDIGVFNFESGMYNLQQCLAILASYTQLDFFTDELIYEIKNDIDKLKKIFINSIFLNHPDGSHVIDDTQYEACHKFLINFESIYTLNYDLLLYWVIVKNTKILFRDGFTHSSLDSQELVWVPENEAFINLYYLHGALHLYQDGGYVKKYSWKNSKVTLKDQIENKLKQNKFPLFVSGGTSLSKKIIIKSSPYLYNALNSFRRCDRAIFIHGFSFNDNDNHIIQAIAVSNIEKLFISIYKQNMLDQFKINESINHIKLSRAFLGRQENNLDVYYYDAETANIWGTSHLETNCLVQA